MNLSSRCVNCAINISRLGGRLSVNNLDDVSRELLSTWISPIKLLPDHMLCKACLVIVKRQSEAEKPTKAFGHKGVCLGCGASILRVKTVKLDENKPETHIIASGVPEIQTSHITRACKKCWIKAVRRLLPKDEKLREAPAEKSCVLVKIERPFSQLDDDSLELPNVRIKEELEDDDSGEGRVKLWLPENVPDEDGRILLPPPTSPSTNLNPTEDSYYIKLPVYKRAPNTSNQCIIGSQCSNSSRYTIPAGLKQKMLVEHKIYIPKHARICSKHLQNRYNTDFVNTLSENRMIHDFNAVQIEDMLAILTKHSMSRFNLEDIENMNGPLRDFWLGVTPQRFYEIIEKCPRLKNIKNYKVGLALYLVKLRTGYAISRISSTFGIASSTVQHRLKSVQDCLKSDNVLWDLGVGRIVEKPVRCVIEENKLMSDDDVIEENELMRDDKVQSGENAEYACHEGY